MKRYALLLALLALVSLNSGCVLTRLVSAPMRVVGGVLTLIPVAGDAVDETLDVGADALDDCIPL